MKLHQISLILLYLLTIVACTYLVMTGSDYYLLGEKDRPHHDMHSTYKPSGLIGHGLGIVGSALMLLLLLYSLRKRTRWAQRLGNIRYWLNYHIWMGVTGPLLVIFHTTFKLGGIVAISFWSMIGVALSGVVGRYIYIQIPRTREGHQLSVTDIERLDEEMQGRLATLGVSEQVLLIVQRESEFSTASKGWGSIWSWLTSDIKLGQQLGRIKRLLVEDGNLDKSQIKEATGLIRQKTVLRRRIQFLETAENLLHYWHVIHKPFAVVMLVIMVVHVVVTVLFGAKWIF